MRRSKILGFILGAGILALTSRAAFADEISMTVAAGHPAVTKGVSLVHDFFIPEVNRRLEGTGHTINWTESYGGSLVGVFEVLEGVESGIADIGYVPTIFEADKLPLEQVTYVTPFSSIDNLTMTKIMDKVAEMVPEVKQAWKDNNQMKLATSVVDTYDMLTNFEWHDVSELAGRKIATGGLATNWLRGTDAAPISGSLPEYYNAVKTGLAEGIIIFESGIAPYKFYEVAPYITKVNYGPQAASALSINLDKWNSLPPEVQTVISEVADAYENEVAQAYVNLAEASLKKSVDGGATIVDFPESARQAYAVKMPNIAKEWAENLETRGLPGNNMLKTYIETAQAAGVVFARDWLAE